MLKKEKKIIDTNIKLSLNQVIITIEIHRT